MIYTNRPWRPAAAQAKTRRTTTMAAATTNDDALVDRLARALARTNVRADGPTVDRVQRALHSIYGRAVRADIRPRERAREAVHQGVVVGCGGCHGRGATRFRLCRRRPPRPVGIYHNLTLAPGRINACFAL